MTPISQRWHFGAKTCWGDTYHESCFMICILLCFIKCICWSVQEINIPVSQ